jgi:hypothetical protein
VGDALEGHRRQSIFTVDKARECSLMQLDEHNVFLLGVLWPK